MRLAVPLALAGLALLVAGLLWLDGGGAAADAPPVRAEGETAAEIPAPARPEAAQVPAAPGTIRTDFAAEAAAPAAAAADAGLLEVFVLAFGGEPVPEALVVAVRGSEILDQQKTDAAGRARLASAGGTGYLVAHALGYACHAEPAALEPGRHELVLGSGQQVTGTVYVDGAPASERIALRLEYAEGTSGLPVELHAALAQASYPGLREVDAASDAFGGFRFEGLPADFRGQLACLAEEFLLEDQEADSWRRPSLYLDGPRTGLALRLKRVPVLRGRILAADGGPPPAGTNVNAMLRYENHSMSTGRTVAADGSFRFVVRNPRLTGLELGIQAPGVPSYEHAVEPIPADWNLGDLRLPEVRLLPFLVLGPGGQPLADVPASADLGSSWSAPSDGDGRGQIAAPLTDVELVARAAGYLSQPCRVAAGDPGPAVIHMQPANMLRVRVLTPDRQPETGMRIAVHSRGPLLEGDDGLDTLRQRLSRGVMEGASWSAQSMMISFLPDEQGELVLTGLRAGAEIQLEVLPPAGAALHREQLPPMPAYGELLREVIADQAGRTFRGRVVDEAGRPIALAEVQIKDGNDTLILASEQAVTGPDGQFVMEQVHGPNVHLAIAAADFQPYQNESFPLPPEGEVSEFRLQRGGRLDLFVQDEYGQALDGHAWGYAAGQWFHSERLEKGHFRFRGLPEETLEARIHLGAGYVIREVAPGTPELHLTIPSFGRVELRFPADRFDGGYAYFLLARPSDGAYRTEIDFSRPEELGVVHVPAGLHHFEVLRQHLDLAESPQLFLGPKSAEVRAGEAIVVQF